MQCKILKSCVPDGQYAELPQSTRYVCPVTKDALVGSKIEWTHNVLDQLIQIKVSTVDKVLDDLLNYLLSNTYSKLPYIEVRQADRISEITALLTAVTVAVTGLGWNDE